MNLPNSGNGITSPSLATAHANFLFDAYGGEAEKKLTHECVQCKKRVEKTYRCDKCKADRYCGKVCQKKHWPEHKVNCKVCDK